MCVWGGAGNKQSNILPKFQVFFYRSLPRVWCAERNIQRLFRVAGRRMESALRRFRPTLSADARNSLPPPLLHSATHDFSFRLILYQLEEEKALPPKVAYYGILYRIFPLSRAAAAANPARGPSFPLFWHSEKMSAYYLFTRRTRRRARATVPRLKMERAS